MCYNTHKIKGTNMTDPNSKKSYTIGFMTYEHRFHSHFMPLFTEIHRQRPDVEKVVFFNGQYKENFNQSTLFKKRPGEEIYINIKSNQKLKKFIQDLLPPIFIRIFKKISLKK